eukprot:718405-Hanusia_phi.AAC.1
MLGDLLLCWRRQGRAANSCFCSVVRMGDGDVQLGAPDDPIGSSGIFRPQCSTVGAMLRHLGPSA